MLKLLIVSVTLAVVVAHNHNHGGRRDNQPRKATVHLHGHNTDVGGQVTFTEEGDDVRVTGQLSGMEPGLYGFHVHEKGDLSGGCATTGGHYNPHGKDHGHPDDENRHVGDLGNVEFNSQGIANINILDRLLELRGPQSIIGRAVVLHSAADDYGRTDHPDSKTTGNAGARVVCGVIGILNEGQLASSASAVHVLTPTLFLVIFSFLF